MKIRVRFAPSPTGYLHVGGLRTALYNYMFAKKHGGDFLLRIEDTDRTRLVEDAIGNLIESLEWAKIEIDEGPKQGGEVGPYIQSERLEIYQKHVQELIEKGFAYYCFASAKELEEMRQEQQAQGQTPMYDGRYRDFPLEEAKERIQKGDAYVVRMKIPEDETIVLNDIVRGEVAIHTSQIDDQVLLKSDGYPTYHLAAVVDDHHMGITHVIRGEEWLTSSPKHLLLYRYFGWEAPQFAHLSLLVNQEKKKLSKRDGDVSVQDFIDNGYTPEGFTNFLALLGWNAGDDKEFYPDFEEMVEAFSLERVHKSSAVFDLDKLKHIHFEHLRAMPAERVYEQIPVFFEKAGIELPEFDYFSRVLDLMRERATLLPDLVEGCAYFYQDPKTFDPKTRKKRWKADSFDLLTQYRLVLESIPEWSADILEEALRDITNEHEVGAGRLIHPTRLATSGVGGGPSLFDMLELLGQECVIRRLEHALRELPKEST